MRVLRANSTNKSGLQLTGYLLKGAMSRFAHLVQPKFFKFVVQL